MGEAVDARAGFADEAYAHEEVAGFLIVKLGAVGQVTASISQVLGNRGDDPTGRAAFDGQRKLAHGGGFPQSGGRAGWLSWPL